MFCSAVIGGLAGRAGGARHDEVEALGDRGGRVRGRGGRLRVRELRALLAPLPLQHDRQAVDDDVQKAADDQAEHEAATKAAMKRQRVG